MRISKFDIEKDPGYITEDSPQYTYDQFLEIDWPWITKMGLDKPEYFKQLREDLEYRASPEWEKDNIRSNSWHKEYVESLKGKFREPHVKSWRDVTMPLGDFSTYSWRGFLQEIAMETSDWTPEGASPKQTFSLDDPEQLGAAFDALNADDPEDDELGIPSMGSVFKSKKSYSN